jgi:Flp pilus assembly protein TadG
MRFWHVGIVHLDVRQRPDAQKVHLRDDDQVVHLGPDDGPPELRQLGELDSADIPVGFGDHDRPLRVAVMSGAGNMRRLAGDCFGGAAIEFAVLAPVLFTMLLGAVDVGRMFYVRQGLEYATESATRYYSLNPTSSTATITTYLQGLMSGSMGPSVNVAYADTTNCNSNSSVTCTTITATYTFTFIASYLGISAKTLTATGKAVRY